MGKVLVPSVMRVGLRLASRCKVILSLSEPVWPHSTTMGSKVTVADMGGVMASMTPVNTVTMHSPDLGVQAHPQSHQDISHPCIHGIACM